MAQSPEYPDLPWIPPRAWGQGRDGKGVRYIVIHYTAGSERATSAEDGARYNQTRTDGTSAHYFVDRDSVIQGVRTRDRANCARHRGNRLGIQYELCGTVQSRAQWLDDASLATLRNAARQVARDCKKYDIPIRRLSVAETRRAWTEYPNGPRGIVGHVDCTEAYPEDDGDHTDPGREFPWDVFLDMVREESEDDMTEAELIAALEKWADGTGKASIGAAVAGASMPAPAGSNDSDGKWALGTYAQQTYGKAVNAANYAAQAKDLGASAIAMIQALANTEAVDVGRLAELIAPVLASAVIAGIPEDRDDITPEELRQAFLDALVELGNRPAT